MFNLPHQSHPCRYYHDERNRKWLQIELFLYFFHIPGSCKIYLRVCVCVNGKRCLSKNVFCGNLNLSANQIAGKCPPVTLKKKKMQGRVIPGPDYSRTKRNSSVVVGFRPQRTNHTRWYGSTHAQQERKPFFLINQSTLRSFLFILFTRFFSIALKQKKKFSFTSCYFLFFLILLLVS